MNRVGRCFCIFRGPAEGERNPSTGSGRTDSGFGTTFAWLAVRIVIASVARQSSSDGRTGLPRFARNDGVLAPFESEVS